MPDLEHAWSLEGRPKKRGRALVRRCPECGALISLASQECPECGADLRPERVKPATALDPLVELDRRPRMSTGWRTATLSRYPHGPAAMRRDCAPSPKPAVIERDGFITASRPSAMPRTRRSCKLWEVHGFRANSSETRKPRRVIEFRGIMWSISKMRNDDGYNDGDGLGDFDPAQLGMKTGVFGGVRLLKFVTGDFVTREGELIDHRNSSLSACQAVRSSSALTVR